MKSTAIYTLLTTAVLAVHSPAASVYINSAQVAATGAGATRAQVKLRAGRNAAWDSALANNSGFGAANARTENLTTSFAGGQTYQFSLENRPGQGLVYTVRRAGSPDSTVAWGSFSSPITGTVVTSLGGKAPPAQYNSITFETRATLAGSTSAVSGLVFSSSALGIANGAWQNSTMTPTTTGNAGAGINRQTLFADTNMATAAWTLSGNISLTRPNAAGSANAVQALFQLRQTPVSILAPVPEPSAAALGIIAAGLLGCRRQRRSDAMGS